MANINTMTAPLGYYRGGPARAPESYEGFEPILGNWMKEARMRQAQPPAGAVDMTGQYRPQPERSKWDKVKKGLISLFGAKEAGASTLGDDEDIMSGALRLKMISGLMNLGVDVPDNDDDLIIKYFELIGDPTE